MSLHELSLTEIIAKIKSTELSQKEVYEHFRDRINKLNPAIEAFDTLQEFSEKPLDSLLVGAPIGIKEVFNEKGIETNASSRVLEGFQSPYDCTIIDRLKKAGFSSMGKLNMDEFAMGGSGENSAYKITKNPWDPTRIPGGSSSGSAAAVAAGLIPASLGTDTGGSIRQPASMCGIVGFKPTYGRNSRFGVIAMASSLDTPGTFTRTVRDAGLLYSITAGHDTKDATSLETPVSIDSDIWNRTNLKGIRVGIPAEYFVDGIEVEVKREIENSLKKLEELGAELVPVNLPHTKYGLAVYYVIMPGEVSTNLARYDGIRFGSISGDGNDIGVNRARFFGKEAQRRIMLGSFMLSSEFYDAYYKRANIVRKLIQKDFKDAFEKVDVIVAPTAPTVAWKLGDRVSDPLKMYLSDVFTAPSSLAGLPGLTVPCGYAHSEDVEKVELPVGLQILGPALGEEKVFLVGHVFEQAMREYISSKKPKIF